jgi:outer membrane protein assembly factor BamE (lipoprotein component of BamABCDE complex)
MDMQRTDPAPFRTALIRAALLGALINLTGCMIPYPSHKVYEGNEIKAESLSWMQPGETTRAQVVERLGAPDIDFVDQRTIAYAWSGQSGGVLFVVPPQGAEVPIRMRRALLIRFDTDNKAAAFSIISRQTEIIPYDVHVQSFDAKYDDWRVILDQWLAKQNQVTRLSGAAPE